MRVIFAKHEGNDKEYCFQLAENDTAEKGYILLVDTMHDEAFVTATTDPCIIEGDNSVIEKTGAYFPLKRVLASIPKTLYDRITNTERKRIISLILANDLSFDLPF